MLHGGAPVPVDELLAHREWVRRMAGSLARDDAEADDLAQEAWVTALEHPPSHAASLRGWFAALLRHRLINRRRAEARRSARDERAAHAGTAPATDAVVAHAELHRRIVDAVMALDEPYRTAVLLRFFEDLPPREIAARLGVSVATVGSRLQRAIAKLRAALDDAHGGRRAAWCVPLVAWARQGPAGAATTAASAAAGGGIVAGIAAKTWAVAAAAVLLAAAGAAWTLRHVGADEASSDVAAAPPAPATARVRTRDRVATGEAPTAAAAATADPFASVDRDLDLHGYVVDAAGAPVPGASLRAVRRPWRDAGLRPGWDRQWDEEPGPIATTATDGAFSMRLRRGGSVDVHVGASGFASRTVAQFSAGEHVTIVLGRGVSLLVSVRDEAGRPVAGAAAHVIAWGGGYDTDVVRADGVTDENGTCAIAALPGNLRVQVFASHEAFAPVEGSWVTLPASGEATSSIVLAAGREVLGVVASAADGRALADAEIVTSPVSSARALADGTFRIRVPAAQPRFAVRAPRHVTEFVDAKERAFVEVRLRTAAVIRGRVVGADGSAVPGACVFADLEGADPSARTARDGRFELDGVPVGASFSLALHARGHGRLAVDALVPPEGVLDMGDVALPPSRTIAGRVLDREGRPAPRVEVSILLAGGSPPVLRFLQRVRTDDLGRFRFPDLSPAKWHVAARRSRADEVAQVVELTADADVLDLVLTDAITGTFTARVRDERGVAVVGAVVIVCSAKAQARIVTDASGVAVSELSGPLASAWVDSATVDGRALRRVGATQDLHGASEAEFVVREMAWIAGRVTGPDGKPVVGEVRTVGGEGEGGINAYSDATGAFRIVVAKGTTWDVEFLGELPSRGGRPLAGGVADVAAGTTGVVLRLAAPAEDQTLTIVTRGSGGEPLEGVSIGLYDQRGGAQYGGHTDAQGRLALRDLPGRLLYLRIGTTAPYTVSNAPAWRAAGWLEPPGWLYVRPRGQEIVLRFRRSRFVQGRIELPDGWPREGASLSAYVEDRAVSHATVAADGTFSMPLPVDEPGPFRIAFGARRLEDDKVAEGAVDGVRHGDTGIVVVVREK